MRKGCGPQLWLRRSWLSVCPRTLQVASSSAAIHPGLRLRLVILNRNIGLSRNIGRLRSRSTGRSHSIGKRRSRSTGRPRSRSTGRLRNRRPGLRGTRRSGRRTVIPQMVLGRFIRVVLTGARFRSRKAGLKGTQCSVSRTAIRQMFPAPTTRVLLPVVRLITVRSAQLMQAPARRSRATLETG